MLSHVDNKQSVEQAQRHLFYDDVFIDEEITATSTFDLHDYDYLVVIDFEATCDNSPCPKVTSDTQEVIEFPFVVVELCGNGMKIVEQQQHYVKPEWSTQLTDFCTELTGITDSVLERHGKSLRSVLRLFDEYVEENFTSKKKRWCIVTDGEWDLKQLLIRETTRKHIPLAKHYRSFFDLRAEFKTCFPYAVVKGLSSMVNYLKIQFVGRHHCGISDCLTICEILKVMLSYGHVFYEQSRVIIDDHYDPFRDSSFFDFNQSHHHTASRSRSYSPSNRLYNNGLFIPQEHYDPAFSEIYQKELYSTSPTTTTTSTFTPPHYSSTHKQQQQQLYYYTYPKRRNSAKTYKSRKYHQQQQPQQQQYYKYNHSPPNSAPRRGKANPARSNREEDDGDEKQEVRKSSQDLFGQIEVMVNEKLTIQ